MTALEKFRETCPADVAYSIVDSDCPDMLGLLPSEMCRDKDGKCTHTGCYSCWDQTIPDDWKVPDLMDLADKKPEKEEPVIKDSGDRTEFSTGAVRDMHEGKGRMDLLPWAAIMEVSKHCENGAIKYGEHNVDRGIPTHSLCDSAARHLAKYLDGWTDEPHLLAAVWNLLWAVQMELKHPDMVDTPWRKE